MRFTLAKILLFFAFLSAFLVAYCVLNNVREGEMNLYAADATLGALKDFVSSNKRWPKSRSELENNSNFKGHYQWPRDSNEVCERVKIDFSLSLNDVVKRGTEGSAIEVSKPIPELALKTRYEFFLSFVDDVLQGKNPSPVERDIRIPN